MAGEIRVDIREAPATGRVAFVTIAHEAKLNTLNPDLMREFAAAMAGISADEALSGVCYTHGVRLGLAGHPLPRWLPTAPRWAREALRTGHASGTAISGRGSDAPA